MINFSINISDDKKEQIVVETHSNDYVSAEDLRLKDARETMSSSW